MSSRTLTGALAAGPNGNRGRASGHESKRRLASMVDPTSVGSLLGSGVVFAFRARGRRHTPPGEAFYEASGIRVAYELGD